MELGSVGENAAQQCGSSRKKGNLILPVLDISERRTEDCSPEEWVREPRIPGSIPGVLAQLASQDLMRPTSDVSEWDMDY